jgi:hypothetical protein
MRRAVLAFSLIALLAACQQPANAPADTAADPAAAPAPVMPADAPPQEEAPADVADITTTPVSCRQELGEAAAIKLVERCVHVSPASHPPCHPDNPCQMIRDEIDRSCALWTREGNAPPECAA